MSSVYEQARGYVFEHGRPLEQRLLRWRHESGPAGAVLEALSAYQNDDGGFGRALEPDLRTPVSSAVATWCAFAVLHEVGAGTDEPLVRRGVSFLLDSYDPVERRWWIVPPQVEDAPRAPWWAYPEIDQTFRGCLLNPTAGLAGALWDHPELVPPRLLADLTDAVLTRLEGGADSTLSRGDLTATELFVQARHLPAAARERAVAALRRAAVRLVEPRPEGWTDYLLQPVDVARTPDSPLSPAVDPAAIEANLDYLLARQLPDGSWPLTWSWAEVDADAWALAERDAKGLVILERLHTLHTYSRLQPPPPSATRVVWPAQAA